MTIGELNTASTFVAILMKLQMEWDTLAMERGLKNIASKITVEYMLLFGSTANQLLAYFGTVLDVLKHDCTTIKMNV